MSKVKITTKENAKIVFAPLHDYQQIWCCRWKVHSTATANH